MKYRQLGSTGIALSEIGLGTWEISGDVWGKKDDVVSLRAMQGGLDRGANFIDTAAGYGSGHAETLVGTLVRSSSRLRNEIIISTKVKPECGQFAPPPERSIRSFYQPWWITSQCEASLRRLQTDYIDILFLHTWSRSWGHEIEWQSELAKLKQAGKVRAFGISIPDEGITDANVQVALNLVDAVQCVFSPFQQEPVYSLFPLAAKHGVGIIARSPFSSGAIVQHWTREMRFPDGDWRATWPLSAKPGWLEEQVSMADTIRPVLASSGIGVAKACLAFILSSPAISSVIPGSANPDHVAENVEAAGAALAPEVTATIRQLWLDRQIHGTYNGSV